MSADNDNRHGLLPCPEIDHLQTVATHLKTLTENPRNILVLTMSAVVVAEKPTTASSAKLVLYRLLARYLTALAARPLRTKCITSATLLFIQETLSSRLSGSPKPALPANGTALRSYVPIQVWGLLRELGVGEKNFQVCTGPHRKILLVLNRSLNIVSASLDGSLWCPHLSTPLPLLRQVSRREHLALAIDARTDHLTPAPSTQLLPENLCWKDRRTLQDLADRCYAIDSGEHDSYVHALTMAS